MGQVDALSRNPIAEKEIILTLSVNISEFDWILAIQLQDSRCVYLKEVLKKHLSDEEEKIIRIEYELLNGRIYRKTEIGLKWDVPRTVRRQIMRQNHEDNGHFGIDKILKLVQESYWFSGMRRYIKKHVMACLKCLCSKEKSGMKPGYLHLIKKASAPMDGIHVDDYGPFVQTKTNFYLLIVVKAFTKFVFIKPVQSTKVGPILKFWDSIFETFGVPRRIVCDRGTSFKSKQFVFSKVWF